VTAPRTQHEDDRCEASASHAIAAGGTHGIRARRRDHEATREAMPRATPDTVRAGALEPAAARAPELRVREAGHVLAGERGTSSRRLPLEVARLGQKIARTVAKEPIADSDPPGTSFAPGGVAGKHAAVAGKHAVAADDKEYPTDDDNPIPMSLAFENMTWKLPPWKATCGLCNRTGSQTLDNPANAIMGDEMEWRRKRGEAREPWVSVKSLSRASSSRNRTCAVAAATAA